MTPELSWKMKSPQLSEPYPSMSALHWEKEKKGKKTTFDVASKMTQISPPKSYSSWLSSAILRCFILK